MAAVPSTSSAEIESFVEAGYVHVREAFPRDVADEARARLWKETGLSPTRRTVGANPWCGSPVPPTGPSHDLRTPGATPARLRTTGTGIP
jgi:hypothetical protein